MDIDPAEISKNRTADVPIVGELREVLPQLTTALAKLRESDSITNHREWLEQVEEWKFKYPYRYRRAGALKPEYVIERLRDLLADRDTIWTTGVGQHQMWAAQWLHIDGSRRWITSGGLGTMGFGFPAALGAKLGRPEATVVCIDGDGCFQMTLQELATAVVYDIPVIVAVMNNGWLGMVRQWQELFHDERFSQTHLNARDPRLREARRGLRRRRLPGRERGRGRRRDPRRARVRQARRDRLPRRPRGEGLPDGARGRRPRPT